MLRKVERIGSASRGPSGAPEERRNGLSRKSRTRCDRRHHRVRAMFSLTLSSPRTYASHEFRCLRVVDLRPPKKNVRWCGTIRQSIKQELDAARVNTDFHVSFERVVAVSPGLRVIPAPEACLPHPQDGFSPSSVNFICPKVLGTMAKWRSAGGYIVYMPCGEGRPIAQMRVDLAILIPGGF